MGEGVDDGSGGGALRRCWNARWEEGALGLLSGGGAACTRVASLRLGNPSL